MSINKYSDMNVMDKRNIIISIFIVAAIACACSPRQSFPIEMELPVPQESPRFDELQKELFSLSPKCNGLSVSEDGISLLDYRDGLLALYDSDGKFQRILVKRGTLFQDNYFSRYISHFLDKGGNVHIMTDHNFQHYSQDGKHIGFSVITETADLRSFCNASIPIMESSDILVHVYNHRGSSKYDYLILDSLFQTVSAHETGFSYEPHYAENTWDRKLGIASYRYEGHTNVKDYGDTVFTLSCRKFIPRYVIKTDRSISDIPNVTEVQFESLYQFKNMYEDDRQLLFFAVDDDFDYVGRYDKRRNRSEFYRKPAHIQRPLSFNENYHPLMKDYVASLISQIPDSCIHYREREEERRASISYPDSFIETVNGYSFKMIHIGNGVYLAETEATHDLWKAVFGEYHFEYAGNGNLPLGNIPPMHGTAVAFEIGKIVGKSYRLPTEREWEKAATDDVWSGTGNIENLDKYANIAAEMNSDVRSVKEKRPNRNGFYDMTGNVSECCYGLSDYFWKDGEVSIVYENYYGAYFAPWGLEKGGSITDSPEEASNSAREFTLPYSSNRYHGLRLAAQL